MNTPQTHFSAATARFCKILVAAVILCAGFGPAGAQEDLNQMFNKGYQLLKTGKPDQALAVFESMNKDFGPTAKEDYGDLFGTVPYHIGICYMKIKEYDKAVKAFQESHTKYNNKPPATPDLPNTRNPYYEKAVLQWAYCTQLQESWKEAIKLYEKFKKLADEADIRIDMAPYYINLGICHVHLGKVRDGEKYIGGIYKGFRKYIPDDVGDEYSGAFQSYQGLIMQGFRVLVKKYLDEEEDEEEKGKGNNDKERAAVAFLQEHRAALVFRPALQSIFTPHLYNFTNEALKNGKYALAQELLHLIPNTDEALADWAVLTKRYGSKLADKKPQWNQAYLQLKASNTMSAKMPNEFVFLSLLGQIAEEMGSNRAAYGVQSNLSQRYPGTHKHRPDVLFNTTRLAYVGGQVVETEFYGSRFLEEFPKEKLPTKKKKLHGMVFDFMLGALFEEGEYAKCVERGPKFRQSVPDNTENAEFVDYVITASHHFLGNVKSAYENIQKFKVSYPTDQFKRSAIWREHITYFEGSNLVAIQAFSDALPKLEAFLKKYPKTEFKDSALLELGQCHFALGEYTRVREKVAAIRKEFPDTELMDRVDMLEGTVDQAEEKLDAAEAKYKLARKKADDYGHVEVSAEGLYNLVGVNNEKENWKQAVVYYNEFFETYVDSLYEAEVAIEGLKALSEISKATKDESHFETGLQRVEKIILDMGESGVDDAGLEKLINSYVSAIMRGEPAKGYTAALARLKKLINTVRFDQQKIKARLHIAEITALQKALGATPKNDEFAAKRQEIQGKMNVTIAQLQSDFKKEDLTNSILMLLATELMKNKASEGAALAYLKAITENDKELFLQEEAFLATGQIALNRKQYAEAETAFQTVRNRFPNADAAVERATIGLGRLYVEQEAWQKGLDIWREYQKNWKLKKWRKATIESLFNTARCWEGVGKDGTAIKAYLVGVVGPYMRHVNWAPEAWYRAIKLERKKNPKNAKKMAQDMIRTIGHLEQQEIDSAKKNFIRKIKEEVKSW